MNLSQIISLVYLISGFTLMVLAALILRENIKNRLNRVASLMLFLAGLAAAVTAIHRSVLQGAVDIPLWIQNSFLVWELFFPTLLYFSAIFPAWRL